MPSGEKLKRAVLSRAIGEFQPNKPLDGEKNPKIQSGSAVSNIVIPLRDPQALLAGKSTVGWGTSDGIAPLSLGI